MSGGERVRRRLEARGTYRRWVMTASLAGMFATSFPVTILAVSLGDIATEFDSSLGTLQWAVSAPMLFSAVATPILGKFGDLYGHRRVFLVGFTVSTLVALLTSLAWDPLSLIGFRVLAQMVGAATQPTSLALVMLVVPPADRVRVMGYWSFVAAGAPALGLALGGVLVDLLSWRLIFPVQSAFGLLAVGLAFLVLPESERRPGVRFDLPGSAALLVGVGGLVFVIGQSRQWGIAHPLVLAALVVAPVALVVFWAVERRSTHPLLAPELLAERNVMWSLATVFFAGSVYLGGFVLLPNALTEGFGYSATATALIMLCRTGVFSVSSALGGRAGERVPPRTLVSTGMTGLALSPVVIALGAGTGLIAVFVAGLVLMGFANGMSRPSLTVTMANAVPDSTLGVMSGFQRMTQQVGNAFGITVLSAVHGGGTDLGDYVAPFCTAGGLGVLAVLAARRIRAGRHVHAEAGGGVAAAPA